MVKITKSFTIEIEKDGQKITIEQDEISQIRRALEEALREKGRQAKQKAAPRSPKANRYISEEKRRAIMDQVGKRLSSKPQTLSSLLHGLSYVPNTLPIIRKMVEGRKDVNQKLVGKRTLYYRKTRPQS